MPRGDSYQLQGQQGGIVIIANDLTSGPFRWIQGVTDFKLRSQTGETTSSNIANLEELNDQAIPAGVGIGGRFEQVELEEGIVIAYYA